MTTQPMLSDEQIEEIVYIVLNHGQVDDAVAEIREYLTTLATSVAPPATPPAQSAEERAVVQKLTSAEAAPEHLDDDQSDAWVDGWNACVAALSRARAGSEAEYELICVNGHDRCYGGAFEGCLYCERRAVKP